ncbi:Beta-glucuronidase [Penicillium daleae]|uniref:Beta-glucuronidase n=1 Tax=Penicillium daleae TaxID=63821 RepID=A0AAD6CEJ2_9EURO|nr:Beta-glucuronidase [Penicillium daleae]KAJ5461381.1 Beta-glucuronidase [Penicillium daleae]
MVTEDAYKYVAPSFAGTANRLDAVKTWQASLDTDKDIGLNSMHNYMGGATSPGVTLAHTLMNHTAVVYSVTQHVNILNKLEDQGLTTGVPYILGEMNSLYHQGAPGLSDSSGAALWGVDFNLYCASQNIRRTHMHQGTNYRYASWEPIETNSTSIGTKAPYYGNAMVAAMLSGKGGESVQVVNLPLAGETEAAYAAYVNGQLSRIAMQEYNSTEPSRGSATYQFSRLLADGSDAISGITWDGWSYNYELKGGKPVRLSNITIGETVSADSNGFVQLEVPFSSAAILNLI